MAEYLTNYDTTTGMVRVKHFSRRVVGGAADTACDRIAAALQQLEYLTRIEENTIRAERVAGRAPRRAGKLKRVPTELSVSIERKSENAVVADFAYAVTDATFYKGDHQSLELEIDAVCALAEQLAVNAVCRICGVNLPPTNHAQSRFCPSCGAENSFGRTAALEILRLDVENRFAHRLTVGGAGIAFSALAMMILLMLLGGAAISSVPVLVLLAVQTAGWFALWLGIKSAHTTLNPSKPKHSLNENFAPSLENSGSRILMEDNASSSVESATSENRIAPSSVVEETTRHLPSSFVTKDLP